MCKSNHCENVLSLVSYYQMVRFYVKWKHNGGFKRTTSLYRSGQTSASSPELNPHHFSAITHVCVHLRLTHRCLHAGAPCVSAAAAAQSVRRHVQPGRRSHLHPPQLHPPHGAGQGPADRLTRWKTFTVSCYLSPHQLMYLLRVSIFLCMFPPEHQKMCYTALVLTMIFSMGEQVPYHHYGTMLWLWCKPLRRRVFLRVLRFLIPAFRTLECRLCSVSAGRGGGRPSLWSHGAAARHLPKPPAVLQPAPHRWQQRQDNFVFFSCLLMRQEMHSWKWQVSVPASGFI